VPRVTLAQATALAHVHHPIRASAAVREAALPNVRESLPQSSIGARNLGVRGTIKPLVNPELQISLLNNSRIGQ
jgi:hypothetical protein